MISVSQLPLTLILPLLPSLLPSPVLVPLKSQLPAEPIEDPASWAWGLHPDNGLDYSAKESATIVRQTDDGNISIKTQKYFIMGDIDMGQNTLI